MFRKNILAGKSNFQEAGPVLYEFLPKQTSSNPDAHLSYPILPHPYLPTCCPRPHPLSPPDLPRSIHQAYLIFGALEETQRHLHLVDRVDWRAFLVLLLFLRIVTNQRLRVATLELVRVLYQRLQVTDTVVTGPRLERVLEGQARQRCEAPGRPAIDGQISLVSQPFLYEMFSPFAAVVNVVVTPAEKETVIAKTFCVVLAPSCFSLKRNCCCRLTSYDFKM